MENPVRETDGTIETNCALPGGVIRIIGNIGAIQNDELPFDQAVDRFPNSVLGNTQLFGKGADRQITLPLNDLIHDLALKVAGTADSGGGLGQRRKGQRRTAKRITALLEPVPVNQEADKGQTGDQKHIEPNTSQHADQATSQKDPDDRKGIGFVFADPV